MIARALMLVLLAAASASAKPRTVVVGAYLHDVQNLDVKTHSFAADVYFWFKWRDAGWDPAASVEFINPNELWGHARSLAFPKPKRLPDGSSYQVLRVQGRFSKKLDLADYPFDKQTLAIELEDARAEADELVFAADGEPLGVNPDLSLPGFKLGAARLEIADAGYPTGFGAAPSSRHSRVTVSLPLERPAVAYGVKLILPVACVIFCAALVFLFHPRHVDARAGLGITALLTIVALQITLNEDLPDVDYLILMDKIYLAAYVFVIACLAWVVWTTRRRDSALRGK